MEQAPHFDIAVVGAGPTGLTAALLLADHGYSVALVAPPARDDGRSVALLQSSLSILDTIACRDSVVQAGSPLATMRLVDDTGRLLHAPEIAFKATELGYSAFGTSILTSSLTAILGTKAAELDNLTMVNGEVTTIVPGDLAVTLGTGDAGSVTATLVVGADGVRSTCREATGLELKQWSYPQRALVTNFRHTRPHDDVSTEFHTKAGPFTLVPIGDRHCGLVWVDTPDVIDAWQDREFEDLGHEIERRSHHILGEVTVLDRPKTFPMAGGYLTAPAADRIALVGEAAHFFPPIGAQGLNLGLRDCAALAKAVGRRNPDPGDQKTLQRYVRARRYDVVARTYGVDLLNRSLLIDFLPVQAARVLGLTLADTVRPLRKLMMRLGMSVSPAGNI